MNIKKAQWLKKPETFTSLSLHSAKFVSRGEESLFFTLGEEGTLTLSGEAAEGAVVSFVFFHTPSDRIVFSAKEIKSSFFGLESTHNVSNPITELEIEKNGDEITFSTYSTFLLKVKNSAFSSSASFGMVIEGEGEVEVSVW